MRQTDTAPAAVATALSPARIKWPVRQGLLLAAILAAVTAAALLAAFVAVPSVKYRAACRLLLAEDYDRAMTAFSEIYQFRDSAACYGAAASARAEECLAKGDLPGAAIWYARAGRSPEAERVFDFRSIVTGSSFVTAALARDGSSWYVSDRYGDDERSGASAVASYRRFLPQSPGVNGLDRFGRVRLHNVGAYGVTLPQKCLNTITSATGVKDLLCPLGEDGQPAYALLLFNDGTVKVVSEVEHPLNGTAGWREIESVSEGFRKIFAIDASGGLHVAYEDGYPEERRYDITGWNDIVKVAETGRALVGLTRGGALRIAYADTENTYPAAVTCAADVADIAANGSLLLLVRANGAVKAVRVPNWTDVDYSYADALTDRVAAAVSRWTGIVRVRFSANGIYGIRFNGDVRYISCDISYLPKTRHFTYDEHRDVAAAVARWTDVAEVIPCVTHTVAVRYDGALLAAGHGTYLEGRSALSGATDYIRRNGGRYLDVDGWKLW